MAYRASLKCSNCLEYETAQIADGTTVATHLTTPSSNADCSNCGCNTLQKV